MGGDYSRTSFDPLRDFTAVGMQQGHPTTDADWNEFVQIAARRQRTAMLDTVGRAVVPRETPTGFQIKVAAGPQLAIGRGRMYVDGLLAENHGRIGPGAAPVFDRARPDGKPAGVLDEMISTQPNDYIDYKAQPYLPLPPALPTSAGPHLVYLDTWSREVTALTDPRLLEPALGGIDTATRWQSVWQVRVLPDIGQGATCGSDIAAWDQLVAPSPARLTTATVTFDDPDDPCLIPPGGGYKGLENQYYRVEIHTGGQLGQAAFFKWSRDNASVGATVDAIANGNRLRVRSIGRDTILRFNVGDWVEITDDRRELGGQSGDMRRVTGLPDNGEIVLDAALSPDLIPSGTGGDTAAARHSRVIKWDQSGKVRRADGTQLIDLDATSDGLIPVPAAGGSPIVLEAGITVSFTAVPAVGSVRAFDYWTFAARTEGAQIEILDAAPPRGIHHHFARLAVVTFPAAQSAGGVSDCRIFWPPPDECGCTVCVSAEEHNSKRLTIQAAIAKLPAAGGTVCLGVGEFILGIDPVVIAGRKSVRLRGHGPGTALAYAGAGGAIRIRLGHDIRITDLAIFVASGFLNAADTVQSSAIHISHGWSCSVSRTALTLQSGAESADAGIALDGFVQDLTIDDNLISAPVAIGALADPRMGPGGIGFCLLNEVQIRDNILVGRRIGISFDGFVTQAGGVHINGNNIHADEAAISATGASLKVGGSSDGNEGGWSTNALWIRDNTISFAREGDGVVSGVYDLRLLDNMIYAVMDSPGQRAGSCIRLVPGTLPIVQPDGHIIGNRLGNADGYGLSVETPQATLLVKSNMIRDCGAGGVVVEPKAAIRTLAFDNNLVEKVATRPRGEIAAGVALAVTLEARIVGNSLRAIGQGTTGMIYCAGFDINGGASLLDLSHNVISNIAGEGPTQVGIGVLVNGKIFNCSITGNEIFDIGPAQTPASWSAIFVGTGLGQLLNPTTGPFGTSVGSFTADFRNLAFLLNDATLDVATFNNAALNIPAQETQVLVSGNLINDAHVNSKLPLVRVASDPAGGNCVFTGNQCTLRGAGSSRVLVELLSARLVVSNNIVRRLGSQAPAMILACRIVAQAPQATIIGNVTMGAIQLNGAPMPAAFVPLNILSA